jgi:hypothetical protein
VTYIGTNEGLFSVTPAGTKNALWTEGSVRKIMFVPASSHTSDTWIILGSEGIHVSADMTNWEARNNGLPVKTIKIFDDGEKSFLPFVQEIKDIEVNPSDPRIMVCATKDRVYLTRDQARTWTDLGGLRYRANGIKAVAVAYLPELTVFITHSLYGIHYIQPDISNSRWTYFNDGIELLETTNDPDEISDIAVVLPTSGGSSIPDIFVSQTFRRRIYKLDWAQKIFNLVWTDGEPFGTVDSLFPHNSNLYFLQEGSIASVNFSDFSFKQHPELVRTIRLASANMRPNCIVIDYSNSENSNKMLFSELWLLDEPRDNSSHIADNKEGIFIPMEQITNRNLFRAHLDTIERAGLNMILIDMKDELGRLRFVPNNPAIRAMGTVFQPLDIDTFIPEMKERGIFVVARVVAFKDRELFSKQNGRFAVWDRRTSRPWRGYTDTRRRTSTITEEERSRFLVLPTNNPDYEILRSYFGEHWVDPYSEEVWDYLAMISVELYERGIDEIQFDYIRFPTDGQNLADAHYRWQDAGMDMESAILSFLRHIRARVKAPISVDLYGANCWYRTGARTGQEVELLAPWVDIICPMYYPSHWDQSFLAQHPPELRPWRIYYYGTKRTARISRGQVIVRPWTQAFFLNVSYDRQFYGPDYVRRQIEGVRQAGTGGYTHWNASGRYADIPNRSN